MSTLYLSDLVLGNFTTALYVIVPGVSNTVSFVISALFLLHLKFIPPG